MTETETDEARRAFATLAWMMLPVLLCLVFLIGFALGSGQMVGHPSRAVPTQPCDGRPT